MLDSSPNPQNLDHVIENLGQSQEPTIIVVQELEISASDSFSLSGQPHTFLNNLRINRKRLLYKGFNQNKYKIGSSFKNRQLCIYCETCEHRILGSSNLDPKSELYQNIQKRVRLPYPEDHIVSKT